MGLPVTAPGRVVRLAIEGDVFGNQMINVHHFAAPAEATLTSLQHVLSRWDAECKVQYLSCMSEHYRLVRTTARTVAAPVLTQEIVYGTDFGVRLGEVNALQVAAIISWRTGNASRRWRGRTFLPAQAEGNLQQGLFLATYQAFMTTYANAVKQLVTPEGITYDLCILSDPGKFLPDNLPGVPAPGYATVESFLVRDVPGTIGKRRVGRGS